MGKWMILAAVVMGLLPLTPEGLFAQEPAGSGDTQPAPPKKEAFSVQTLKGKSYRLTLWKGQNVENTAEAPVIRFGTDDDVSVYLVLNAPIGEVNIDPHEVRRLAATEQDVIQLKNKEERRSQRGQLLTRLIEHLTRLDLRFAPWEFGVATGDYVFVEIKMPLSVEPDGKNGPAPADAEAPAKDLTFRFPSVDDLLHRRFLAVKLNGNPVKVNNDHPPILEFNGEKDVVFKISGRMCNQFTGNATLKDGVLSARLAATMKMCIDPVLMELEQTFHRLLADGAKIVLADNNLLLFGELNGEMKTVQFIQRDLVH